MKLIVTIDAEGDDQWSEERRKTITTENARFLGRFQELCEKYGFQPTYLTAYEMALDKTFVSLAKKCLGRGACEIGLHPHPWNSPPAYALTEDDAKYSPCLIEYPAEIICEKVDFLTALLETVFETKIVSHRAGRWGFNEVYARILQNRGFQVDCSVTPHVRWDCLRDSAGAESAIDYRGFPVEPYFLDLNDVSQRGTSLLLELPMTIRPRYPPSLQTLYDKMPFSSGRRLMRGLFGQPVAWLRPMRNNMQDLITLARKALDGGSSYLMFMLHSSELMPGGSPLFRSDEEIEKLYEHVRTLFCWCFDRGVKGVTCKEFYRELSAKVKSCP